MDTDPPVWIRNFDPNHPFDQAVSEFHLSRFTPIIALHQTIEEKMERMFRALHDATAGGSEAGQPLDRQFIERRQEEFRYLLRASREKWTFFMPQIRTLDLKLCLLAELLTTDEEKLVLRALGILPGNMAQQHLEVQELVWGIFQSTYFHQKVRDLVARAIAKFKSLG